MAFDFQEMLMFYGVKSVPTIVKNPQANAILERSHQTLGKRTHQTLGNMLRAMQLHQYKDEELKGKRIFDQALSTAAYALRTTYHTKL